MKTRIHHIWEIVSSGYWFVPAVMMVGAAVMAFGLLGIDRFHGNMQNLPSWLYSGGSDGAKTLLSTVAGSVITVAGVVFSITIVALTQASSQFGPRLLRNFMQDKGNQLVLGTFVATFVYCLLVLRSIHGKLEDGGAFVPQVSVTVAVLLAVASIAVLIYFTHHVSVSLQAPNIIAAISANLAKVIDQQADERTTEPRPAIITDGADPLLETFEVCSRQVTSTGEGYVQAIDYRGLLDAATRHDLVVRLHYRPGEYVIEGSPLLLVWPAERCNLELAVGLNAAFFYGNYRTAEQDVEHGVREMVEIAVRALSPGINDPFTAINCINALAAGVCRAARMGLPRSMRYDSAGKLRLVVRASTFAGLADAAFDQIRQYGANSVAVTIRLLEVLGTCGKQVASRKHKHVLRQHVESVYRHGYAVTPDEGDREDIRRRYVAAIRALDPSGQGPKLAGDRARS